MTADLAWGWRGARQSAVQGDVAFALQRDVFDAVSILRAAGLEPLAFAAAAVL